MPRSSSPRHTYAAVLRVPHVPRTFAAALVARLSYGTVSLAMILTTARATGSYAVAGVVMALFGALSVLLSPARAALVDRYGPRRALLPMAVGYAALLTVFAVLALWPSVPVPLLGAAAVAAGACTPPVGPTMRSLWAQVAPEPGMLQRAYSLDGVAEEMLFVSGPLLVGALVRWAPPAFGVVLSALLVLAGTLALVMSPVVAAVRPSRAKEQASAGQASAGHGGLRGLARPVVVAAGVGLALGAVDLLVVAFAGEHHHGDAVVARVFAALSAGSAAGGLLNGAVDWRAPARVRLPLTAAGLGLALFGAASAPGPGVLAVTVACAGFFVGPALTTAYLAADESAPPGRRTRAGAWVNTGVNAGNAGGAAGAGLLIGHMPPGLCFAVAGAAALAAALFAALLPAPGPAASPGASPATPSGGPPAAEAVAEAARV